MNTIFKKVGIASLASFAIALSFFAGLYVDAQKTSLTDNISALYFGTSVNTHKNIDMNTFWKAWDILQTKFVDNASTTTKTTDEQKVYGAIKGLAESMGDPYTTFFNPEETKGFKTDLSGTLEGIGAVLNVNNGVLTAVSIIKDSPAEKYGLQVNDKIIKVDDKEIKDIDINAAVGLIRGKKGTKVKLTILRGDQTNPMIIEIVRDTITTPVVQTKKYPSNSAFVIELTSFTSNSAELFRSALKEYVDSGLPKLIIDLRNNTGGYLDAAVDMASWFVPEGKAIVTEDFGKNAKPTSYVSRGFNLLNKKSKVILLVNENSASASEILAGALHDYGIATLIGTKTYGKGSVQELIPVTDDTVLKITIARWLTPNGLSISHNGIKPDVEVKMTGDDYKSKRDPQLDKALNYIINNN